MNSTTGYRLIIVALLTALCIFSFRSCRKNAIKAEQYKEVVQLQHDTIVHFKDRTGKEHVRIVVQQADLTVLKALHQQEIDSLTGLLNIKEKQIDAVVFTSTKTTGTIKPKIDTVFIDSAHSDYNLSYADKWLSLNGTVGSKSQINYTITDSLVFTTFRDKKGLIKVDAFSLNPNSKYTGLSAIRIPTKKQKQFAVGPYFGVGYSKGKWEPQYGVGIHYNLIRF